MSFKKDVFWLSFSLLCIIINMALYQIENSITQGLSVVGAFGGVIAFSLYLLGMILAWMWNESSLS